MESLLFTIRGLLPDLPSAERKIAEHVLSAPGEAIHKNITELAAQSGVSQAAIVRFCRRIEVKSFSEFKIKLSQDVFRISDERFISNLELKSNMDPATVVGGVIGEIHRSMDRLQALSNIHFINRAVDIIRKARVISIFGVGASALAAQDLFQKLIRVGFPCLNTQDTHLQITSACNLKKDDVALIFSYTGEIPEMLSCARWAKKRGAYIIALTSETENTLNALADVALRIPSQERIYKTGGATVSLINQIVINDMIYYLLVSKNLEPSVRALNETMAAIHNQELDDPASYGGLH